MNDDLVFFVCHQGNRWSHWEYMIKPLTLICTCRILQRKHNWKYCRVLIYYHSLLQCNVYIHVRKYLRLFSNKFSVNTTGVSSIYHISNNIKNYYNIIPDDQFVELHTYSRACIFFAVRYPQYFKTLYKQYDHPKPSDASMC